MGEDEIEQMEVDQENEAWDYGDEEEEKNDDGWGDYDDADDDDGAGIDEPTMQRQDSVQEDKVKVLSADDL